MKKDNLNLMRPTTPGQIYELWLAGRLEDKDFGNALKIVEKHVGTLVAMVAECEQWEVEGVSIEVDKYKLLHREMMVSKKPVVQGQKAAECLKLAEKNWTNAALCENADEQLVHLERCLTYACTAGLDPFEFIVGKVKETIIAA